LLETTRMAAAGPSVTLRRILGPRRCLPLSLQVLGPRPASSSWAKLSRVDWQGRSPIPGRRRHTRACRSSGVVAGASRTNLCRVDPIGSASSTQAPYCRSTFQIRDRVETNRARRLSAARSSFAPCDLGGRGAYSKACGPRSISRSLCLPNARGKARGPAQCLIARWQTAA